MSLMAHLSILDHKISLDVQTEHWDQPNSSNVNAKVTLFQPKIKSLITHFIILDLLNQNSLEFHTEHLAQHALKVFLIKKMWNDFKVFQPQ